MQDSDLISPVALDISATNPAFRESHVTRGIGRYVGELLAGLQQIPNSQSVFSCFDHCELLGQSRVSQWIDYLPCGRVTARQQLLYPFVLNSKKFQKVKFLHFPAHMDAAAWGLKPYILTVLDLIPLILKDLYAPEVFNWRFRLARFLELRAIKGAQHIIAISQTTADDVHRLLGVPYENITVTPLGVDKKFFEAGSIPNNFDDELALRVELGIPQGRPVLLYVGGIDARKNVGQLLKLTKALVERALGSAQVAPVLVLVGSIKNDKNYPDLQQAIKDLGLLEHVVIAGYLSEQQLLRVYKLSSIFCFLSLYEGFGLPPLEAMAVGVPVLSSNRSCLPEILGQAALLTDPENLNLLVEQAEKILNSKEAAQELSAAGLKQSARFTWSRTAELTMQVYQRLLREQGDR